ncbi:RNA 2',3'-cyclic phosphodiesterase [Streptomyces sp. NPDC090052]|uniref:RNA 2',3'-cyclic phosphodiesterase n=1 Tax=unclassified Streptomyces TaxID=2593676 RepID=UPI0022599362|nr:MULTISPECIES: RNA 2',3'-cyclic phosphodiesterase [unclassified Streptomyces]MCX4725764.1 RNA 2',3'-cyclic phosphodiesterase [Streptomyces sp. NBC_01306]WSV04878.1 RNA 2',3'-cyclic phosphodiesterase [Streptomyces sp. NBC_01020]WSX42946.1 RNA 2',3'-cyclic phosphodiesterase [Streptomyces sp. NBC_00963]WSX69042.1 RNA 2',3'-cyclic phosphodiesterase [Streptomyces sp. NBC_00932]
MRLFVALLPPQEAALQLGARVDRARALPGARRLRWTERPGWHFTLAFLGEVDDDLVPALETRLALTARDHAPFALRIAGGGRFGDRALWAGAAGGVDAMGRLAAGVEAAVREAGAPMEREHPYVPHLTLARGDGLTGLGPYAETLAGFESSPWTVRELALVRSGRQPRYEVVAARPLGPGK